MSGYLSVVAVSAVEPGSPDVPGGEVLIVAGGLTRHGTLEEITDLGEWLRSLPHTHKIVVAGATEPVFEGSHELARRALGPGIHFLENEAITIQGQQIYGYYGPTRGSEEHEFHRYAGSPDVLVSWAPPAGVRQGAQPMWEGDFDVAEVCKKMEPRFHVFGGQDRPGTVAPLQSETTFINCYQFPWRFSI